jgi:Bromodomain
LSWLVDFGTVTANLVEGRYQSVEAFATDCRLIISNCLTYYDERDDGKIYVEQANKLNECLSQQLDQLIRYDKSSKAITDRAKAKEPSIPFTKPSPSMLSAILADLRAIKYTDKPTKMTQSCTAPYEEPVVASTFPDYSLYVRERMDLTIIDKKIRTGSYEMLEDFDYDVNLLFKNYEDYNTAMNIQHAVAIAKFGARKFRLLLLGRLKSFDESLTSSNNSGNGTRSDDRRESVSDMTELIQSSTQAQKSSGSSSSPPGKKLKMESSSSSDINNKKKKAGPKISIALANSAASTADATSDEMTPATIKGTKVGPSVKKFSLPLSSTSGAGVGLGTLQKQKSSTTITIPNLKPNQPLPLHIAIQRVKEGFPIRRAVKTLQSWEADCARYFKELMRHPWISAARPKFIFHVPVPVLYPELRDTYASKIKHPMDLTTIECSLVRIVLHFANHVVSVIADFSTDGTKHDSNLFVPIILISFIVLLPSAFWK